jgi:hypothetical protein
MLDRVKAAQKIIDKIDIRKWRKTALALRVVKLRIDSWALAPPTSCRKQSFALQIKCIENKKHWKCWIL